MEPAKFVKEDSTTQMFTVTERAAQEIQTALKSQEDSYEGIRVGVQTGGGCCGGMQYALGFEKATQDGDVVVEAGGIRFFVSPTSAPLVQGATIDFVETPMGAGFQIKNPNEAESQGHEHGGGGGCGCGGHGGGGGGCGCGSGHGGGGGHGGGCGC